MNRKWIVLLVIFVIILAVSAYFVTRDIDEKPKIELVQPSSESDSSNFSNFGRFLTREENLLFSCYLSDSGSKGIFQINWNGGNLKKILDVNAFYLSEYNGYIYYVDIETRKIYRMLPDGNGVEYLTDGTCYVIDNDTGDLYFSNFENWESVKCLKSDGTLENITIDFSESFQIYKGYLYYRKDADFALYRMDLKTRASELISETSLDKYLIYGNKLFYNNGSLYEVDLDSLNHREVIKNVNSFTINNNQILYLSRKDSDHNLSVLTVSDMDGNTIYSFEDERIDALNSFIYVSGYSVFIGGTFETEQLLMINNGIFSIVELDRNRFYK